MKLKSMKRVYAFMLTCVMSLGFVIGLAVLSSTVAYAKDTCKTVTGSIYEFDEDSKYNFSGSDPSSYAYTDGSLSVSGNIYKTSEINGITSFAVKRDYTNDDEDYNLIIAYTRTSHLTGTVENIWSITEDNTKKVDFISLDSKIGRGAIIIQTSKDGINWITSKIETDVFKENPSPTGTAYSTFSTNDVQLANGCYYRVIVAYELAKPTGSSKFLFFNKDNYEYKKQAEVYEFYAYDVTAENTTVSTNTKKYNLGSKVRTKKFEGYYGSKTITNKDPHYGWDLGQFFVSGYTDTVKDTDGNIVFLKNVGDQVSLWFNLQQDLNALNGNSKLTLEADIAGSDQYFETPIMDFGRGALIIRKNTYENVTESPVVYTNYLEATATVGANTKVDLFEEGDYEVALDYSVKNDKILVFGNSILPGQSHYRIYFRFSVRNSNSMFYPRDVITTSELANNVFTRNGFYLDLAKSHYLQLNIVKEVLKDGATGLTEDVRLNTSAKDGDRYTDEGIYTITVTNQYTNKSTTKKIYVGENNLLKAYMVTGLLISEIQDKIANGATIADDGTIVELIPIEIESGPTTQTKEKIELPEIIAPEEESTLEETITLTETIAPEEAPILEETAVPDVSYSIQDSDTENADDGMDEETKSTFPMVTFVAVAVIAVVGGTFFATKKKRIILIQKTKKGE